MENTKTNLTKNEKLLSTVDKYLKSEIKDLNGKLNRACKEAQALEWAFDQTGRMSNYAQSKYLYALKIQAYKKCEEIQSKIINLEVELLRSSRNTN